MIQLRLPTQLMPYDVYERHKIVGSLLQTALASQNTPPLVLDVGGRIELLEKFMPYRVISVNPDGTGAVYANGLTLPFADNAFAAVVNIDTLEHLPSAIRIPFIQECLRVTQQYVIIAAPYGSQAHIQHEKELHVLYQKSNGRSHPYLSEHIQYGLPTPAQLDQIEKAISPATVTRSYAGDYIWQGKTFARAAKAAKQPRLQARFTNAYNQIISMAFLHPIRLSPTPNATTNRFYLFIEKGAEHRVAK